MHTTRRRWLAGSFALGATALCGPKGYGQQPRAPRSRVIDAHTHWFPAEWVELVERHGAEQGARIGRNERGHVTFVKEGLSAVFSPVYIDVESRIRAMDEVGVQAQVMSLMSPMVNWASPEFGMQLARAYNDAAAAAHRRYPDRLFSLAIVPMQAPELAAEELQRASQLPGLRGLMMATEINGKNLDEKSLFPLYAKCEELGWPIFPHPINPLGRERMTKYALQNLLGNPIEIGLAGYTLILGGVLDTFPRLTVMLPRAGGNVPWGIARLDRTVERQPQAAQAKRPGKEYLRQFYFDTIIESAEILMDLIRLVGVDRVVFGTDYASAMRDARPVEFITGLQELSADERDLVLGGNAARLFQL